MERIEWDSVQKILVQSLTHKHLVRVAANDKCKFEYLKELINQHEFKSRKLIKFLYAFQINIYSKYLSHSGNNASVV